MSVCASVSDSVSDSVSVIGGVGGGSGKPEALDTAEKRRLVCTSFY